MDQRVAGVLCPVSMLPSRFGIGDFGKSSRAFVDLAAEMGMKLWQILPLNPLGYGHSPYQPFSSFAIDDLYMDLDALYEEGLLAEPAPDELGVEPGKVDYEKTKAFKAPYIEKAYKAFMKKEGAAATLNAFMREHPWCKVYALFMYLKKGEGMRSWAEWPKEKKDRISSLAYKNTAERTGRLFETWIQYELYREWDLLREYAHGKGIKIVGDVPFYVGYDSADVYENRDKFLLDPVTLEPTFVAGVPPDYFSATGQRWGNPIYDWDKLKKEDYELVVNRLRRNGELYDIIRLDHFRAFDTYWKIPSSCPTAVEGEWILGPATSFFDLFLKKCPNIEIIAEDLGDLRPEVLVLRDHYAFPGMNVVEFTFDDVLKGKKVDQNNMVAYLGTHDNDPMKAYLESLRPDHCRYWMEQIHAKGYNEPTDVDCFVAYALSLEAKYTIIAAQDYLGLGKESRLNVPGVVDSVNWTFRLASLDGLKAKAPYIRSLVERYGRL